MTEYWKLDGEIDFPEAQAVLAAAGELLRRGRLVAFPTETVYGLGADARNREAVRSIFAAKGRPSDNPLIVHIADAEQLDGLAFAADPVVRRLIGAFWPGPLTMVLPAKPGAVAPEVTAGLPTVAVRMPAHPVARALIRAAGCPIAAPSANRSGRPSPAEAGHVREDLDGRIAAVIDAGPAGVGVESTVVEPIDGGVRILRPGGVTAEDLRRIAGRVELDPAVAAASGQTAEDAAAGTALPVVPRSPGMKYAHYAPRGRLAIVSGAEPEVVAAWIQRALDEAKARGETTGVLTVAERAGRYRADVVAVAGRLDDPATIARGLFGALRRFDECGATYLLAEAFPETGIGLAVMNRLRKAAGGREIRIDP